MSQMRPQRLLLDTDHAFLRLAGHGPAGTVDFVTINVNPGDTWSGRSISSSEGCALAFEFQGPNHPANMVVHATAKA